MTPTGPPEQDLSEPRAPTPSAPGAADPLPPEADGDSAAWERFVHAWQDRMYALSLRVLRNRTAATDATQEIFLTLWRRRDRYDRTRALKPWLYSVAMNTIRAELRRDRKRQEREREAAVTDVGNVDGDRLEEAEQRQVVASALDALPAETRALVLLHYQHGLSQREIARTLRLRRSTVGDRLKKALDVMRASLRRGGHLAAIPLVEQWIGATKLEAAPPLLTESLLAVPRTASAMTTIGATGSALTLGGLTMAKVTPTLLICLCALSLAVGFGAGTGLGGSGAEGPTGEELDAATARFEALERDHAALSEELAELLASLESTKQSNRALREEIAQLEARAAATAAGEEAESMESLGAPDTIDWNAIATAFENDADLLLWIGDLMAEDLDPRTELPREDRERFGALQKLWDEAAAIARRDSAHPFLEPEVLTPLLAAVLAGPLGLDAQQQALLEEESARLLAEWPDAAAGTPLEAWQARQAIMSGVKGSLEGMLGPEQAESWSRLSPLSDFLLGGSQRNFSIGIGGAEGIPERVRSDWNQHYRIRPEQEDRFEATLADYDRNVRGIMQQALGESGTISSLPPADRERLRDRYLAEQLRAERRILEFLDEEQLAELKERLPDIWVFEPGGNTSISFNHSDGF